MTKKLKTGRHPSHEARPGRQEIWEAIKKQEGWFTIEDVWTHVKLETTTIYSYLTCLAKGGYLAHEKAAAVGEMAKYKLLRDTGHHAPRLRRDGTPVTQGKAAEQMWTSAGILKRFTYRDLISHASIKIPEETAKKYCAMLLACGYLRVLKKADPVKGRIAQYLLIRNDGPKPPQIQRVKRIYDPNTDTVYEPEGRS